MVRQSGRTHKVADQIQREISEILLRDLRDPRVGMITLTGVEVSPDFAHATVYFTCLEADHASEASEGLGRAAGFIRAQLAKRIRMYTVPELRFLYDESVERGAHLSRLIDVLSGGGKR